MFLISLVILVLTIVTWYQMKYRHRNALLAKIPAPPKYPLIHNSYLFFGKTGQELFKLIEDMSASLGPIYHMTTDPFDNGTLVFADPKMAEGILSSQKILDKSEDYDLMKAWLGTGLLISTGKKWHQRRKIITPSFHFQILERFVEVMDEHGKVMVEKLKKLDGQEVDMFPLVNLYALDVICESAMGVKMNAQLENSPYVKAVKEITELIYERSFDAIRRIDFIYQFTEMYRHEKRNLEVLHGFTDGVIKARRDELLSGKKSQEENEGSGIKRKMALLDLLLQSSIEGVPLTNLDIREEVDTFMFEGHDTTTSGISFCLYNIAKYPEVQQKIFEEIQAEISSDDEVLTLQILNKLHYLELVIKESLRLFPSVPFYARKISEETTIGDYTLPKNCNVAVSPYLMGRDPKIFSNPLKFDPARFDVETTVEKMNPYAYVPFSAGPRNCIGQKFAIYELKSSICKIVKSFQLSISKENETLKIYGDLILKSANGVKLTVKKR